MTKILELCGGVLVKNGLITAFALVGAIMWASYYLSAKLTRGRLHGSAIAIAAGLVLAYICLVTALNFFEVDWSVINRFDHRFYFNIAMWMTAAITVWTGIDYIIKYFYMIKTALK